VLGVEVVEEERRASPDPGDGVKPPPRQAQDPVPVAIGLSLTAAHEDVEGGGGERGRRIPGCPPRPGVGSCSPAGRRRGEVRDRSPWWRLESSSDV
jgi:hypothetical protein